MKKKLESFSTAAWRGLFGILRSTANKAKLSACVCLRQLTRCLCFLLLPRYLLEVWRFDDFKNLRDVRFYFKESCVIIRRYWRARFMVVRCWLAFFRLVHMFGWKFAVARVKLTGVGFKFWPNENSPSVGATEKAKL